MSPRAACQLEAIGFEKVYDYTLGIADWKGAGLAVDGTEDRGLLVADATRPDVPTVAPDDLLGDALANATDAGWNEALVVDCDGIVVGRLRDDAWAASPDTSVVEVMESGPTTVRPDGSLPDLHRRMKKRGTRLVIVSDPQGRLIGIVLIDDARRLSSGESPVRVWQGREGCPGRWRPVG